MSDAGNSFGSQSRSHSSPPRLSSCVSSPARETTLMLRNIPTKFNQVSILESFSSRFDTSCVDFFYMPVDFKSQKSLGFAFINFSTYDDLESFVKCFQDLRLCSKSSKTLSLTLAKIQGKEKNYNLFKSSSVMTIAPPHFRPMMKCHRCSNLCPLQSDGSASCDMC